MIQSRPILKSKKLITVSLLLLILAVMLFPTASLTGKYAAIIQIFAIASSAASLFLLIKYVIPDYLYTLENGHFTIHKITKSQSVCIADINIESAKTTLLTSEEYKKLSRSLKIYSYLKNPGDSEIRFIIFSLDGEEFAIQFEPDEYFRKAFSEAIESITIEEEED